MIELATGPLIVQPDVWTVVFSRVASSPWLGFLAPGRYKHVRAYAYVPYLHVWVFVDPHIRGTDLLLAADGAPAQRVIAEWIPDADLLSVRRVTRETVRPVLFGHCVPVVRRIVGVPGSALLPCGFFADCLRNGGQPFETLHGRAAIQEPTGRPGLCAADGAAAAAEH